MSHEFARRHRHSQQLHCWHEKCIFLLTPEVEHVRLYGVSGACVKFSIDGWHFPKLGFKKSPWHGTLSEHPLGPYMSHSIANNANLAAFLTQYLSTMHCPPFKQMRKNLLLQTFNYLYFKFVAQCNLHSVMTNAWKLIWLWCDVNSGQVPAALFSSNGSSSHSCLNWEKILANWKLRILGIWSQQHWDVMSKATFSRMKTGNLGNLT